MRAWPVSDLETLLRDCLFGCPMTERAGVVVKLATPIRMLPTTERCRLISAHKKYPAQAELTQHRFKVSGIGDLRGDNDVQRPPLAKSVTRSRLARCVKPYCLRPRCLMCGRWFVGLAATLGPKERAYGDQAGSCKVGNCVAKAKGSGHRVANTKSEKRASRF